MVHTVWHDEDERHVIEDVQKYGWHVVLIEDAPEGPAFAYSVGIWHTLKQPEVIIFGLNSLEAMGNIINVIGDEMRKGTKFEDWMESDQILDGYNCIFRHVDTAFYQDHVGYAMWFHRSDNFPVLQCVWPDQNGRYPWHPEYPAELRFRQPVLAQQHPWRFQEGRNRAVFTTRHVLDGTHPVLLVSHEMEGDWQFLCGTTNRTEDGRIVCLATMVEQHPAVADLADLPLGWQASRNSVDQPWQRTKTELQEEEKS